MCCDFLFSNDVKVNNINSITFAKLSRTALQNSFFNFEGKTYKQIYGLAMTFPQGLTLENEFLCFNEQIWLNECRNEFKPA